MPSNDESVSALLPLGQRTAYVYLQLPGSLETVTCGRVTQVVLETGEVRADFVYGRNYRARRDAVPLDEFALPLGEVVPGTTKSDGMFGALRDASPDWWGRSVIHKQLGQAGLTEVDYLLYSPEDRSGALSFGLAPIPPAPSWTFNSRVHLAQLREAARLMEATPAGAPLAPHIIELSHQLLRPGTSMGGARPKNVVEDDAGLWLAKFPARNDSWNSAAVEAAMLDLAQACEIPVPTALVERLGDESVLLLSRFDRERASAPAESPRYLRYRMVSALTVLDLDDDVTNRKRWSYLTLADELRRWAPATADRDRLSLFRRMVLNALVTNTDDHPRNHALVAQGRAFALSPVYDVTPHPTASHSRDLAMSCGPRGRSATRQNLRGGAPHFGLSSEDADSLITAMARNVAANWEHFIRRRGGSSTDCDAVRSAMVPPSIEDAPQHP